MLCIYGHWILHSCAIKNSNTGFLKIQEVCTLAKNNVELIERIINAVYQLQICHCAKLY